VIPKPFNGITMSGEMRHIEMFTHDIDAVKEFYGDMFTWEFKNLCMHGIKFLRWEVCCGLDGVFKIREEGSPDDLPGPVNYISVDNISEVCKRIEANGGDLIYLSEELIKGGPRIGIFADPDGTILGLWQKIDPKILKEMKT
jgi:predicted enzyme related to lactoylglutathione lyase